MTTISNLKSRCKLQLLLSLHSSRQQTRSQLKILSVPKLGANQVTAIFYYTLSFKGSQLYEGDVVIDNPAYVVFGPKHESKCSQTGHFMFNGSHSGLFMVDRTFNIICFHPGGAGSILCVLLLSCLAAYTESFACHIPCIKQRKYSNLQSA